MNDRPTSPDPTPIITQAGCARDDGVAQPGSVERAALEHLRHLVERHCGASQLEIGTRKVDCVGVVGAGIMGAGIAAAHAAHYLPVVLNDADEGALDRARETIVRELRDGLPGRQAERLARHLVTTSPSGDLLDRCGLVIESIPERLKAKQELYEWIEKRVSTDTILASNTSTIPIGRLAARLAAPERFCGLHFCHPVHLRPLVEVVRGSHTSDGTIATVVAHARRLGKIPVVVEDGPGFVVNRLLSIYLGEALALLLAGIGPAEIDRAMVDFGMALGPFELLDEIGLDTAIQSAWNLSEVFGERVPQSPLLVGLVKARHLGRKSAVGFYCYASSESQGGDFASTRVNPELERLISQWRGTLEQAPVAIADRLLRSMASEAERLLEERKVRDPGVLDLASVFGLGFPAAMGGVAWWNNLTKSESEGIPSQNLPGNSFPIQSNCGMLSAEG